MFSFDGGGTSSRTSAPVESTGSPSHAPVPSVLWVPDEDVRLLLRGILALQRYPVALEISTAEPLRRWEPPEVALLIVDAVSGPDRWRRELAEALRVRPELRAVVLLPRDGEALRREAESLGARATLVRPFAVRDLVRAIREALRGTAFEPDA